MLCLPPAGAGASAFYPLLTLDSPILEICPIALPGREDRFGEAMPRSIGELADMLLEELRPVLDRRYAVLGYSMGALLAWELAKRWRGTEERQPEFVIALAARAPHRPYGDTEPLHTLESAAFVDALATLGGMPAELLAQPEAMEIYEPIIRNDLRNCETYAEPLTSSLQCPVHALVGDRDALVPRDDAEAWGQTTTGPFQLHMLAAKHILTRDELIATGRQIIRLWQAHNNAGTHLSNIC